jgi:hypothetical protein
LLHLQKELEIFLERDLKTEMLFQQRRREEREWVLVFKERLPGM